MIIGNGVDIIDNKRIEKSLKIKGFKKRLFTLNEIKQSKKYRNKTNYFAKRFAAKEAFAKALGTGIRQGVSLPLIEVSNNSLGKPQIKLHQTAKQRFDELGGSKVHLSISDERNFAVAQVVIEQ